MPSPPPELEAARQVTPTLPPPVLKHRRTRTRANLRRSTADTRGRKGPRQRGLRRIRRALGPRETKATRLRPMIRFGSSKAAGLGAPPGGMPPPRRPRRDHRGEAVPPPPPPPVAGTRRRRPLLPGSGLHKKGAVSAASDPLLGEWAATGKRPLSLSSRRAVPLPTPSFRRIRTRRRSGERTVGKPQRAVGLRQRWRRHP